MRRARSRHGLSIFPVILDARPAFLNQTGGSSSLLLTPLGTGSLLCQLHTRFAPLGPYKLTIVPSFSPDTGYASALRDTCALVVGVVPIERFTDYVAGLEPSDWLLFLDPRCFVAQGVDPGILLDAAGEKAQSALHLLAPETNLEGTRECVDVDGRGSVRRIVRYYDMVTWNHASGVAASLVPVSCIRTKSGLPLDSLSALRTALSRRAVPAPDLLLAGRTFDLTNERELLALNEEVIRSSCVAIDSNPSNIAPSARVDKSARLIGAVVLHADACVEHGATVVGPTVIGRGARIAANAIVAQCVVSPGVVVPAAAVVSHSVVSHRAGTYHRPSTYQGYDRFAYAGLSGKLHDEVPRKSIYPRVKAVAEPILAVLALFLVAPLMLLIALLIKLDSSGPVLYIDRREAKGGKIFPCLKFRTMHDGTDLLQRELFARNQVDGPQFKLDKDPRVTRVGGWIRPFSLDELPQLINVGVGQMSFIGPRPSPFRENQTCVPWRETRLSVNPGISGLWQLCHTECSAERFHQWIYYDLLYAQHMSPMVDFKIALATVLTLGGRTRVPLSWIIPNRKLQRAAPESQAAHVEPAERTSSSR